MKLFFFFWCDGLIIRKNVNLQKEGKEKEKKKKVSRIDDVAVDVVQQECNNNKYYISVFRYIYIYIDKLQYLRCFSV